MKIQDECSKKRWAGVAAAGVMLLALLALPTTSFSQTSGPVVLPLNGSPFVITYAELGARWWQWGISMSLSSHPLADTADCSQAQLGPVWYLGGQFNGSATASRICNVPAGKALFFPILNVECSNLEGFPFYGATAEDRRTCARALIDNFELDGSGAGVTGMFANVDGVAIQNLTLYRVTSPDVLVVSPPEPNVLGVAAGLSGQSTGDGYYLLLAPLSAGKHTLHFGGHFVFFNFDQDITYHLNVKK